MNKLLVTFTDNLDVTLMLLKQVTQKIYVLRSSESIICSYNAEDVFLTHTIPVHRHGETNTLYTLNAIKMLGELNFEDYEE